MILRLVTSSASGGQGAIEEAQAVVRGSADIGLAAVAAGDDPPLGFQRPPDGFSLLAAKSLQKHRPVDIIDQGGKPSA